MTLQDAEKKLSDLLKSNKKSWTEIYKIIELVDYGRLYEPDFPSFTKWLEGFAEQNGVSKQLLWKRKRAGKYYNQYRQDALERGVNAGILPEIDTLQVSPDNLEIAERICELGGKGLENPIAFKDNIMERVLTKELRRTELNKILETLKAKSNEAPVLTVDNIDPGEDDAEAEADVVVDLDDTDYPQPMQFSTENISQTKDTEIITVVDIVSSLSRGAENSIKAGDWLGDTSNKNAKYRTNTEVLLYDDYGGAVYVPLVVLETVSEADVRKLKIHCIDIRNTIESLAKPINPCDNLTDYFWVAVPPYLKTEVWNYVKPGWGILVIDRKNIHVSRQASKKPIKNRDEKLSQVVFKSI